MTNIPLGWVNFHSHEAKVDCLVRMAGPAKLVQHHGEGWQQVQRWGKKSLTQYQGAPGWELGIPVIFDGFRTNTSQERWIRELEILGGYMPDVERTPRCTIDAGGGIPHDLTNSPDLVWIISVIEWGDYISNTDNDRVRQEASVTAWEYVPGQILEQKNVLPTATRKRPTHYKIKKGDTLQKIAAHFYGDQSKWHALARANHIRDPNHPPLKTIRLPNLTKVK